MTFKQSLIEIDDGRFKEIIMALNIKDVCQTCSYFTKQDGEHYLCHILGKCIDSLNPEFLEYLKSKLKEKNEQ